MSLTIGEAAIRSGVPAKTIRYYEQIGLIGAAARGANQYRAYSEADVAILRFVGRARRLGFSVQELKQLVALYRDRGRASADVKTIALHHIEHIDRKLAELRDGACCPGRSGGALSWRRPARLPDPGRTGRISGCRGYCCGLATAR